MDNVLNLGDFNGHKVYMDTDGTQATNITISGFDTLDKIMLNEATNITSTDITTFASVATTGYTLPATSVVGAIVTVVALSGATSQVSGALAQLTDAGAVEAAIIAAGLVTPAGNASNIYMALDNGTDTGIYRMAYDEVAANGANAGVISAAAEITGLVLIGTLSGMSDVGTLNAANFSFA